MDHMQTKPKLDTNSPDLKHDVGARVLPLAKTALRSRTRDFFFQAMERECSFGQGVPL